MTSFLRVILICALEELIAKNTKVIPGLNGNFTPTYQMPNLLILEKLNELQGSKSISIRKVIWVDIFEKWLTTKSKVSNGIESYIIQKG